MPINLIFFFFTLLLLNTLPKIIKIKNNDVVSHKNKKPARGPKLKQNKKINKTIRNKYIEEKKFIEFLDKKTGTNVDVIDNKNKKL